MAYGHKTGGRTAGTPNKVTSDLKSRITALMEDKFDAISSDLEQLEPKDRVTAYLKFLEYVLPKQREQLNTETETYTQVTTDEKGGIIIERSSRPFSTPFQIISPDTGQVEELNIGADKAA